MSNIDISGLTADQIAMLSALMAKHGAEQRRKEEENEQAEQERLAAVARSAARNSTAGQTRGARTKGRGTAPAAPMPGDKPATAPVASMQTVWAFLCAEHGLSEEEKAQRFGERLARATAYRAASRYFGQRPGEGPGGRMGVPHSPQAATQARRDDEANAIRELIGAYYPWEPHGVQLAAADSAVRATLAKANGTIGALLSPRERSKALASLKGFAPGAVNASDKVRADLLARRQAQSELAGNAALKYESAEPGTVLAESLRADWLVELARLESIEDDMLKLGLSSKRPGLSL
jgi:plasmid stabilization system protein ParE